MWVTAIVLAAGKGVRFIPKISKPLAKINSKPTIVYALQTLGEHPDIKDIIVVVNASNKKEIIDKIKKYKIKKVKNVISGGRERQDSVRRGLQVMDRHTDLVLVHDGVRPFVKRETISLVIKTAAKTGAAIVGVPVKATIKKSKIKNPKSKTVIRVDQTLNRDNLWEIQTPQVFRKDLILEAYRKYGKTAVTDDSALVEKLGVRPCVVRGSYLNIKITASEDLVLAGAIAKSKCLSA